MLEANVRCQGGRLHILCTVFALVRCQRSDLTQRYREFTKYF